MNPELMLAEESPSALEWQHSETLRAERYLQSLSTYSEFSDRLYELTTEAKVTPFVRAGNYWFQKQTEEFDRLVVLDRLDGRSLTVFDASDYARKAGLPVRLVWYVPSPDGSKVALAYEVAGVETVQVAVFDVAMKTQIPTDIPWYPAWPVSWLTDSSGFYIDSRTIENGEFAGEGDEIYQYHLGERADSVAELIPATLRFPRVRVSADRLHTYLYMDDRVDYVRDAGGAWSPFLRDVAGAHVGEFYRDDFFAIVTDGHPRGRLVRIPTGSATDIATWQELVPETDDVLLYVSVFDEKLILGLTRNLCTVIEVRDHAGKLLSTLDLPEYGTAGGDYGSNGLFGEPPYLRGDNEISFTYSTPISSPAVYRFEIDSGELTRVTAPAVELSDVVVEILRSVSADGTSVPYTVIRPIGKEAPLPTVIEGYGNFGLAVLPSFNMFAVPVLEAGGAYVLAHLRGGGEFGVDWWNAGRLERKQNTFDDLYSIAEALIQQGVTTSTQLAFHGASGGGLTAGSALVQRPDLFAAIVARSPVLDLLTREGDNLQDSIASREYGSLANPDHVTAMRRYSPVENVRQGVAYPPVMFVAGENDPRTKAWQSRKMAALITHATCNDAPVLLRVHPGRGHAAVGSEAFSIENGEWLAFIAEMIGLHPQPKSRKLEATN